MDSIFPNSVRHATAKVKNPFKKRKSNEPRRWNPPALHPASIALAILTPLALITTLVLLLKRSQRDNGIIFAPDINALPLSRTFMYQYFPTILAVLFSIFWAWIDLEVKRLEPWHRLSKKEGALGKDSLLLSYPFGFVPLVPIRALKNRHWTVFWASLALVLVTWGLVPTQSGIFATERVTRIYTTNFDLSTSLAPTSEQPQILATHFAQSTYSTLVLNESLPEYTTRNFTLAPFKPSSDVPKNQAGYEDEFWTAPTTLYSLDLQCEIAFKVSETRYNNSKGCSFGPVLSGNDTMHTDPLILSSIKGFSAQYAGYYNLYAADFYLSSSCPQEQNHTFFAAFTRNKEKASDPPQNVTAIFCTPEYYSQKVNATVESITKHPTNVTAIGSKRLLDTSTFNSTWMEQVLSNGLTATDIRSDTLPDYAIPNYFEKMADVDLSWTGSEQSMLGLAVLAGEQTDLQEYLDWRLLATSYAKAYRLLFSRAMADVLKSQAFAAQSAIQGEYTFDTDAVVLEPVFTYIVIGILGVLTVLPTILLFLSVTTKTDLYQDPGSIASIMGLVANNDDLLADFEGLDCCTNVEIGEIVGDRRYKLVEHEHKTRIEEVVTTSNPRDPSTVRSLTMKHSRSLKVINKPVRPMEFSSWMTVLIFAFFLLLAIGLAILFIKARSNGLALPSQNSFVQNLIENYIPTALATLIEPIWVLLNRLLCLLQPIEELQDCSAKAKDSIDLNYASLPPQLVIWKALRAHHLVLTSVCSMALLANLLAIAFAGLFHHQVVEVRTLNAFDPPFELSFVPINGSLGPTVQASSGSSEASGAYRGGNGRDQFLTLQSNYTGNTSLLAWTDKRFFYLPFLPDSDTNNTNGNEYEAETLAFGAQLDCKSFTPGSAVQLNRPMTVAGNYGSVFNSTLIGENNVRSTCVSDSHIRARSGPVMSIQDSEPSCQQGPISLELTMPLDTANINATQTEREACWSSIYMGWIRNSNGSCEGSVGCLDGLCSKSNKVPLDSQNSFFVECTPKLVRGRATIRVDKNGRLLKEAKNLTLEDDFDVRSITKTDPINLIGQSNKYIFTSSKTYWHNDSYTNDFMNYFIRLDTNSSRLVDPNRRVPTLEDVQVPLGKVYASLFAAWMGANKHHLLLSRTDINLGSIEGWKIEREERLFMSTPLFAIAEGILCIYAITICVVYIRRPGKYLARLPTSIASVVPLFAGSTAVQNMRGISQMRRRARLGVLEQLDHRYGYGSYVGMDGRVHVGIEKTPFVRPWRKVNST